MKKKLQKIIIIFLSFLILLFIGGFVYIQNATYTPTTSAKKVSKEGTYINHTIVFEGEADKPAILFYQGAFVENASYSIWAKQVADAGFTVYLVDFPLNLAVLEGDKAQQLIDTQKITNYYIGGHSLGGVMASRFASAHRNNEQLKGVFFFASYPDKKGNLSNFDGKVLSLTGSKDGVLNWDNYEESKAYLPLQTTYRSIEGGNHSGFGSYGFQKGDQPASINPEEQQAEIANELIHWLDEK